MLCVASDMRVGEGGALALVGYHRAWSGAGAAAGPGEREAGTRGWSWGEGDRGLWGPVGAVEGGAAGAVTHWRVWEGRSRVERVRVRRAAAVWAVIRSLMQTLACAGSWGRHSIAFRPALPRYQSMLFPHFEPDHKSTLPRHPQILAAEVEHLHMRLTAAVADKDAALAAGLGRLEADLAAVTDERDDLAQRMRFLERQLHK